MERIIAMINPRTTKQPYAPPSEFDLMLECMEAQRFGGHTISGLTEMTERKLDQAIVSVGKTAGMHAPVEDEGEEARRTR
jgi:hypothetical protein